MHGIRSHAARKTGKSVLVYCRSIVIDNVKVLIRSHIPNPGYHPLAFTTADVYRKRIEPNHRS